MALKGINLGGWLIVERWMTPDLFIGVEGEGERAIGQQLGSEVAAIRLGAHRESFITEKDFRWIAAHGFDFVRLPVGYWLFEDAPGFISGEKYVQKAFEWAQKHNLKILLDFHGLPGSQNGQDHSGEVGRVRFYRRKYRRDALKTVDYLTRCYGRESALLAVELINEPKIHWFTRRLTKYYIEAFRIAQRNVSPHVKVVVSDAFQPLRLARTLCKYDLGPQLVLDVHLYQLFSVDDKLLTYQEHINKVEGEWYDLLRQLSAQMPIIVGEWSAALPAEMPRRAAPPDATEQFYCAQRELFDKHVWAHSYWSYKAPGQGPWDFRGFMPAEKKQKA